MIDFISTRATTDAQSAACARLLAAVIASAVSDACRPLSSEERRFGANRDSRALDAIEFLFSEDSVFPPYAAFIGSSADAIRRALLAKADDGESQLDRRSLHVRMALGVGPTIRTNRTVALTDSGTCGR